MFHNITLSPALIGFTCLHLNFLQVMNRSSIVQSQFSLIYQLADIGHFLTIAPGRTLGPLK